MSIHVAIPEPTSPQSVHDSAAYNLRALPQYLHCLRAAGATPIPIPLHESPQRVAKILTTVQGILLPGSPADIDPQKYGHPVNPHSAPPDPARAAVDELLLQEAFNLHKPILAICQGLQSLNTWCGGTLIQDIPTEIGPKVQHAPDRTVLEAHPVQITPHTRLSALIPNDEEPKHGVPHISPRFVRGDVGQHNARPDPLIPLHESPTHLYVNSSHHQAIQTPGDNLVISAISPQDNIIEAVELASPHHFVLAVQWHPERTYDVSAFSRNIFHAFVHAAESWTPRRIEESVLQV